MKTRLGFILLVNFLREKEGSNVTRVSSFKRGQETENTM